VVPTAPLAYLDHAASTPMRPEAVAAMVEVLEGPVGNPSGQHGWARAARRRLDDAREQIADAVGAHPAEVVFTSGGTEADNLAIAGTAGARGGRPTCMATDHHAALAPVRAAGGHVLDVAGRARLAPSALEEALRARPGTSVVSFAGVNNELGVVQPAVELADAVRRGAPEAAVHVDAVAAAAWIDLAPIVASADLVSLSGHKVGGPLGVGALVVRAGAALSPVIVGGAQERERRGGTPNVAGAVGFAAGLAATVAGRERTAARVAAQRDRLRAAILGTVGDAAIETVAGEPDVELVANVVHLSCRDVHREALLFRLDAEGVAASAGSSCASGATQRSHVVDALGLPPGLADGALRLSLGWTTTDEEVALAGRVVAEAILALQGTATAGAGR
jgi:cysteine desulfurase